MTREEAEEYAKKMSYRTAIYNLKQARCVPYKKATFIKAYKLLDELEKIEWIPVSERLPEAYQKVLVTYEKPHWANEPTTYGVKSISFGGTVDFIAWMPLPEPYEPQERSDKE